MRIALATLALSLALAGCATGGGASNMLAADAPRALPPSGPVSVAWSNPADFSEITSSGNRQAAAQGDWLLQLAQYMRKQAARQLPPGYRLELTIEDIKRAGQYEPWRGVGAQDVRACVGFADHGRGGRVVGDEPDALQPVDFLALARVGIAQHEQPAHAGFRAGARARADQQPLALEPVQVVGPALFVPQGQVAGDGALRLDQLAVARARVGAQAQGRHVVGQQGEHHGGQADQQDGDEGTDGAGAGGGGRHACEGGWGRRRVRQAVMPAAISAIAAKLNHCRA